MVSKYIIILGISVRFLVISSLLFTSLIVSAQDAGNTTSPPRKQIARVSLAGKVTDLKSGQPLAGASIYFSDIKSGSVSNEQGRYKISNLPKGRYLVEVSFLGYTSVVDHIDLKGDIQRDFTLNPSVVENEAVTVTGVSSATSIRKSAVPVDILKRQDLLKTSSTNLIDALSRTPGVSQISTGPAISKPTIRGLGYNRLVVVNDGMRQEGQQWGDEHGIEIDEYSVNKVEILKGPASIMYGSDALAGVINILTNVPIAEGTVKANILSNYQTNNGMLGLNANVAGNINGFNWNAYGSHKSAYDYTNKYDGRVFNSKFGERNFGGYVGVNKSWGYSHLLVSNFDQTLGLTEGNRDSVTGQFTKLINAGGIDKEVVATNDDFKSRDLFIPKQHIQHFKVSTDNSFRAGDGRITLNLGFQRNQRQEFGNVLDPEEKSLYFDLKTVNYNLQYHLPQNNNWETTIGVNGMQQNNTNRGVEVLIPAYNLFDVGGFIYSKKSFDKLTLSGGLRLDNRALRSKELLEGSDVKFQQFSKNFTNLSGSIGFSYETSKAVTLKLNLARGFRAPSIPELASNGAHEGTNRYEYGERNLKSETSLQADAGIDINTEHVSFSANLFYNSIKNFIFYRKLSSVNGGDSVIVTDGHANLAFRFDQNDARLYGAEFNLDIHPHPLDWLHIENTFSYVRGTLSEAQDGSNNLPFIPAGRLVNQVRGDFSKKGKLFRNAYLLIEADNTFAQNHAFTGYNTETTTPSYSLFNAGLGGDITSKGKTIFSIYLSAKNITDVAYQSNLSRLKYTDINAVTGRMGVFNMGRNFSFKVNIPLSFEVKKP
jgi:iron complex outermembrane receptor protein